MNLRHPARQVANQLGLPAGSGLVIDAGRVGSSRIDRNAERVGNRGKAPTARQQARDACFALGEAKRFAKQLTG